MTEANTNTSNPTPTRVSFCLSMQAQQERIASASRYARLLGEQHPNFAEPVLLHAHHSAVECGSDRAWGQCQLLNPATGELTPHGAAPEHAAPEH